MKSKKHINIFKDITSETQANRKSAKSFFA